MPAPAAITPDASRPVPAAASDRVESVDVLRGLVITLMIFVNDIAGVPAAPAWLKHAHGDEDAMTLPDVVFPAFLFIAGVSIPLALERALAQGRTRGEVFRKIVARSAALLVMGVLMVNEEEFSPWPRHAWGLQAWIAMLLAFVVVPRAAGRARTVWRSARIAGWAGLAALALAYRIPPTASDPVSRHLILGPWFDPADTVWLRHSWWGILGLIGWAYLVAATLYLVLRPRREWLVGAAALLILLYPATHASYGPRLEAREWLGWAAPVIAGARTMLLGLGRHVSLGESLGALASISMAGCALGSILTRGSDIVAPAARLRWAGVFAAGLLIGALLCDPLFGLNKIRATPSWCLLCAALAAGTWMLLYLMIDLRGHHRWSGFVRPAGANPLLAYLLHPLLYLVAGVIGVNLDFYHRPDWPLALNLGGSLLMALLVVQLTGLVARAGYRLKV